MELTGFDRIQIGPDHVQDFVLLVGTRRLAFDHDMIAHLAEFEILPGVPEACARLKAAGFLLVVATNQPDVGRGTLKQEAVEEATAWKTPECPRSPIPDPRSPT